MRTVKPIRTTQIGSLPHPWIDAAVDYSLREDIPFFPQLLNRNSNEFLIPQALHSLPGLKVLAGGYCELDLNVWNQGSFKFNALLDSELKNHTTHFEPSLETSSAWNPFLFELEEKKKPSAKIQICGPYTGAWALKGIEKASRDEKATLSSQIVKLVLIRACAMARSALSRGIDELLIYIDEPGLFTVQTHEQSMGFRDLALIFQSLKKLDPRIRTALHCCNQTLWNDALGLPIDFLSFDAGLSLEQIYAEHSQALAPFFKRGSRFSLGVIGAPDNLIHEFEDQKIRDTVGSHLVGCILTPACGLGMNSISVANEIQTRLQSYKNRLEKTL